MFTVCIKTAVLGESFKLKLVQNSGPRERFGAFLCASSSRGRAAAALKGKSGCSYVVFDWTVTVAVCLCLGEAKMRVGKSLLLLACAVGVVLCSDLDTFSSQFLGVLLPSPLDPVHQRILPQLDDAANGYAKMMNSSGLFPDVDYSDSSDRSEWAAAEHLRRCLIFGISSRSNMSAHFMEQRIIDSARSCLSAWLNANFYNSNWSVAPNALVGICCVFVAEN